MQVGSNAGRQTENRMLESAADASEDMLGSELKQIGKPAAGAADGEAWLR